MTQSPREEADRQHPDETENVTSSQGLPIEEGTSDSPAPDPEPETGIAEESAESPALPSDDGSDGAAQEAAAEAETAPETDTDTTAEEAEDPAAQTDPDTDPDTAPDAQPEVTADDPEPGTETPVLAAEAGTVVLVDDVILPGSGAETAEAKTGESPDSPADPTNGDNDRDGDQTPEADEAQAPAPQIEPETAAAVAGAAALAGAAGAGAAGATAAAASTARPATTPTPAPTPAAKRRGSGLIGGFLGGAAVVALAVLAAPRLLPPEMMPVMDVSALEAGQAEGAAARTALAERLATLEAGLASRADAAEVAAALEALRSETAALAPVATQVADLAQGLDAAGRDLAALVARIDTLERRPLEDATDPATTAALEAYGREVAALRDELAAMRAALAETVDQSRALVTEAATAATAAQQAAADRAAEAEAEAARTALRQGLVDLTAALENGSPLTAPLAVLAELEPGAALTAVAGTGVPTLAALQAGFGDPARAALDAARAALDSDNPIDRGKSFLLKQLGVRSLAPKEGDGADAVLSRAEQALREGRLADALAGLDTLDPAARDAMSGWIAQAQTRAAALAAAEDLATRLANR